MSYMVLRSYYAASASEIQTTSPEAILGKLVTCHTFATDEKQRFAWQAEIAHLQKGARTNVPSDPEISRTGGLSFFRFRFQITGCTGVSYAVFRIGPTGEICFVFSMRLAGRSMAASAWGALVSFVCLRPHAATPSKGPFISCLTR